MCLNRDGKVRNETDNVFYCIDVLNIYAIDHYAIRYDTKCSPKIRWIDVGILLRSLHQSPTIQNSLTVFICGHHGR